jgi:hypothetical protein
MGLSKSGMSCPSMGWCSTRDYNELKERKLENVKSAQKQKEPKKEEDKKENEQKKLNCYKSFFI